MICYLNVYLHPVPSNEALEKASLSLLRAKMLCLLDLSSEVDEPRAILQSEASQEERKQISYVKVHTWNLEERY